MGRKIVVALIIVCILSICSGCKNSISYDLEEYYTDEFAYNDLLVNDFIFNNNEYSLDEYIVNKAEDVIAHCSVFAIDNDDNVYIVYYASQESNVERIENTDIKLYLTITNLDDLTHYKRYLICESGMAYWNYLQGDRAPYDPNIYISDNTLYIYFMAYINKEYSIKCITFDIDNETFISELIDINFTYKGEVYPMSSSGLKDSSLLFNQNSVNELLLQFTAKFNLCDGSIYAILSSYNQNNFKGYLLKTNDMINFEIVYAFTELEYAFQETALYIKNNYAYIISRCDVGQNLYVFDLLNNNMVYEVNLSSMQSRPFIFCYESNIYLVYNIPNNKSCYVERATLRISKFSYYNGLAMLEHETDLTVDTGIHYPWIEIKDGNIYMTFSTDLFDLSSHHDRANIIFSIFKRRI